MDNRRLEGEIQAAVGTHAAWRVTLTSAINQGKCDVSLDQIGCGDKCAFGKWLHGPELDDTIRAGKPFQVIERIHAEFHKQAKDVAALAIQGKKHEAFALMDGEYKATSDKLLLALNKWRGEVRAS